VVGVQESTATMAAESNDGVTGDLQSPLFVSYFTVVNK
jgi:hypothetical protein